MHNHFTDTAKQSTKVGAESWHCTKQHWDSPEEWSGTRVAFVDGLHSISYLQKWFYESVTKYYVVVASIVIIQQTY